MKRIQKLGRKAYNYAVHYLVSPRGQQSHSPFYKLHPYSGQSPLFRADEHTAVDLDFGFLFHRVPKAANSVVAASIAKNIYGTDPKLLGHAAMKSMGRGHRVPSSLSAMEARQAPRLFKFVVVRHPYARVLSAYLSKARFMVGKGRSKPGPEGFPQPNWAKTPSFPEFCEYLANGGLYANVHWSPQTEFLLFPPDRYDLIGRVETLEKDLDLICERILGRPGPYSLVKEDARHATGAGKQLDEYFTPDIYAEINRLYAADFAAFGYEKRSS